jgi:hypothetical protein
MMYLVRNGKKYEIRMIARGSVLAVEQHLDGACVRADTGSSPKPLDSMSFEEWCQLADQILKPVPEPPRFAEFLLAALASSAFAEAAIGDLNERFCAECERLGERRAVRLYRARTLRSFWPLLRRAIGKAIKWGVAIDAARRLFTGT